MAIATDPHDPARILLGAAILLCGLAGVVISTPVSAAPLRGVLDVSVEPFLGADLLEDQEVFFDDLGGVLLEASLGPEVASDRASEVIALHKDANATLFVLDAAQRIAALDVTSRDVVSFDGVGYAIAFEGAAVGVPVAVTIDALTRGTTGDLVFSFDGFVELGGLVAADEDLVRWNGSVFSLEFDGSAEGVPIGLDLDAASYDATGALYLSFDGPGRIAGVDFFDEDLLQYDPSTSTWAESLGIDTSSESSIDAAAVVSADLRAIHVPEPRFPLLFSFGVFALAWMNGVRQKRRRSFSSAELSHGRGLCNFLVGVAVGAVLVVSASPALAGGGVLEINQACAITGGCFPGDNPGFPVEITASAGSTSFRLTGDLEVPAGPSGISVVGLDDATIDLAGFRIIVEPCIGASLPTCAPLSGASGVFAAFVTDLTIHDGAIVGMGERGIRAGDRTTVKNVNTRWNSLFGIEVGAGSMVLGGSVAGTGGDGMVLGSHSFVEGTLVMDSDGDGISATEGPSVIRSVVVESSGESGISATEALVQDSAVRGSGALGISLPDQSGIICDQSCVIERNSIRTSVGYGIRCGETCVIAGNRVESSINDGVSCTIACLIEGNVVANSVDDGIHSVNGGRVVGNTINVVGDDGISVGTTSSYQRNQLNTVTGNYVTGAGDDLGGNVCDGALCP